MFVFCPYVGSQWEVKKKLISVFVPLWFVDTLQCLCQGLVVLWFHFHCVQYSIRKLHSPVVHYFPHFISLIVILFMKRMCPDKSIYQYVQVNLHQTALHTRVSKRQDLQRSWLFKMDRYQLFIIQFQIVFLNVLCKNVANVLLNEAKVTIVSYCIHGEPCCYCHF